MKDYIRVTILVPSIYFCGFFMGRMNVNKIDKVIEEKTIRVNNKTVSEVQIQQEAKKDAATVKIKTKKEIHYSPNGNISKIVEFEEHSDTKILNVISAEVKQNTFNTNDIESHYQLEKSYKNNWMIQTSYPLLKMGRFNHNNINLGLGYRVFSDVYLTTSINYLKLKEPMIGVSIGF